MKTIIANIIAIYRKELQGYFASPLALAIAAVFWLVSGFFFIVILLGQDGIIAQVAIRDSMGITDPPIDAPYEFLQFFLSVMGSFSLFVLPMLSMGLYAEERKRGTLELLATSPLYNWTVATGKLLGVITFYTAMLVPLLLYEALAFTATSPPLSPEIPLLGHAALILLGASVLSLGMFVSSLTDSTLLAAIFTFVLVLFLWVIDTISQTGGGILAGVLEHLSLLDRYSNLIRGVVDTGSLVLFASYIVLGIFLTAQSIEALRFGRS